MAISKISKKRSQHTGTTVNPLESALATFFVANRAIKEDRKALKRAACEVLLKAERTASVTMVNVEGMNKASIAKLERLIAPASVISTDWDKAQRKLTLHVEKCAFTESQREDLRKGKIPQIYTVEREVDLDALSRRIQSMLKGLDTSDIEAVLSDVTESLKDVEKA